jgi:hypothetical protein
MRLRSWFAWLAALTVSCGRPRQVPVATAKGAPAPAIALPPEILRSSIQLSVVAQTERERVSVHPLGGRLLVLDDVHVAEWRGDRFVRAPELVAGLPACDRRYLVGAFGRAPLVWLMLYDPLANERFDLLYAWQGRAWTHVPADVLDVRALAPWSRGRFLGIDQGRGKGALATQNHWFFSFDTAAGVPEIADCGDPEKTARVTPQAMLAFPSGAVFVAGNDRCELLDPRMRGAAIERWGPSWEKDHVVIDIGADAWLGALAGSSETDVYAGGRRMADGRELPYLLHFDGAAWTPIEAPLAHSIESLALTTERTLWVVGGGVVLTRARSGTWSRIALPVGLHADRVQADGDDVWVEADRTVLSTRRAREPLVLPATCGG